MRINVLEYFEETVSKYGDKCAIRDRSGELSFTELGSSAKKLVSCILNICDGKNNPVIVFLPKSKEAVVSFVGILYSGNFYVPIDIKLPDERLRVIFQKTEPACVITNYLMIDVLKRIDILGGKILYVEDICKVDSSIDDKLICSTLTKKIDVDPIYMIYTSGSTGIPKGVLISHRGVIDYIEWAIDCYNIDEREVIGNQAPFYFDNSTLDIYLCLFTGATLVLIPEDLFVFPPRLLEYLNQQNINFIFWVPSVLVMIANMRLLEEIKIVGLKKVLFAGEIMPNKQLNYWRKNLPHILYSNLYGPTEITVDCTYYTVTRAFSDGEPLPIGIPCRNSDVLIINANNKVVKEGELGELCVRGSCLALGYYRDLEKTNLLFVQNPLHNDYPDRIYKTGDMVYLNERQEIIFVGRQDSQVKHMGYRIELGEIELAILELPGIYNCCVMYDSQKKEIYAVCESEIKLDIGDLRKKLSKKLPGYVLPNKFYFFDKLPMNSNGKIDRKQLRFIVHREQ